jgi:ribose transport system substrate-binding protein
MVFVGKMSVQKAQDRVKGFKDAVAAKGIKVLDVMQDQADKNKARKNVEDTIQAHPDISALVGIWSYNLPAIAAAVKESGKRKQIKVIGFDAEPLTLKGLEEGDIDATVVQKPYEFGYQSVKLLYALITGDDATVEKMLPADKIIDTGVEVITPGNVADYKANLEKLGIKSS